MRFVGRAEGDGDAVAAGAGRAADAVDIGIRHFRQVVVEDMADAGDVDAARGDVGGDEDADFAVTEGLQGALALALALVAVDRGDGIFLFRQVLGQLFRRVLGAHEHHGLRLRIVVQRLLQKLGLVVLAGEEMHILLDLVGGFAGRRDLDLDRVLQEAAGEIGDRLRHGRREKKRLALGRNHAGDAAQIVDEAEIEHLVGLVQHQMGDMGERDGVAVDEIEQAAGRGDEDVGAALQDQLLLVDRGAADDLVDPQRRLLEEGAQAVGDLVHQLTGRREDENAGGAIGRAPGVRNQHLDDRQAEGGRLAGAGLGETDQVASLEQQRNRLLLYRRRRFITESGHGRDDLRRQAERLEIGQNKCLFVAPEAIAGRRIAAPWHLASRTPREVGTCVGKCFPALVFCPPPWRSLLAEPSSLARQIRRERSRGVRRGESCRAFGGFRGKCQGPSRNDEACASRRAG